MRAALSRIILYLAVILLPILVIVAFHLKTADVFFYNLGRSFAQDAHFKGLESVRYTEKI